MLPREIKEKYIEDDFDIDSLNSRLGTNVAETKKDSSLQKILISIISFIIVAAVVVIIFALVCKYISF